MSAILEALKKLEQETTEPSGHPLHREIDCHKNWRKASLAGFLAAGIIICGFAGYGVVVLTRKASVAPEAAMDGNVAVSSRTVKVSPVPEPAPAVQPAPNPVMAAPSRQETAPAKTETPRHAEEISPKARDIVAVALAPDDLSPETIEEALPPHEPTPAAPAEELIPEAEDTLMDRPESDSVANAASEVIPEMLPGVINDPEAVLQAISWSRDAGRRMAVINGKICREREPIGGYVILKINPEDVVVSKGAVTGRLVFKIH